MKSPEFDETKLQIVMEIIDQMSSLAATASLECGDEESDKLFGEKMNELDRKLRAAAGKGLDDCEPFLDFPDYTTLEMAAKRTLMPPEQSDLVKLIENRLSPYGFKFSNYQCFRWTFSRIMDGITQHVVIQGDFSHEFVLEIFCNGTGPALRIREITNYDAAYPSDFIKFNSEEERTAALNKIADIVITYGIDKLCSY